MTDLIVVGTGDHYSSVLAPSLSALQQSGEITVLATVDTRPLAPSVVPLGTHLIRPSPAASLARLLASYHATDPVIYLAHSHYRHAADALDLLADGFRVVVEKPYALSVADLRKLAAKRAANPRNIAFAEYYLMTKAAPLLAAADLFEATSFYCRDHSALETLSGAETFAGYTPPLAAIGNVRFIYVDILEGKGDTGRFDHRGKEFADARLGGGAGLDLGVHALAPLCALAGIIGDIRSDSIKAVGAAAAAGFCEYATTRLRIPRKHVPDTFFRIELDTATGVPAEIAVAKYMPPGRNQRRLILLGDEGAAVLDLSQPTLYLSRGDAPFLPCWRSKKQDAKYVAVVRACLASLDEQPLCRFDMAAACLRAQEIALRAVQGRPSSIPSHKDGAKPAEVNAARRDFGRRGAWRTWLPAPARRMGNSISRQAPEPASALQPEQADRIGFAKTYYEHQYERMGSLEDQGFRFSNFGVLLATGVLTFASHDPGTLKQRPGQLLLCLLGAVNLASIFYMLRVNRSVYVHQQRAKSVLRFFGDPMAQIDAQIRQRFVGRIRGRPLIQILLHILIVVGVAVVLAR